MCPLDDVVVDDRPGEYDFVWLAGIRHRPKTVAIVIGDKQPGIRPGFSTPCPGRASSRCRVQAAVVLDRFSEIAMRQPSV